MIPGICAERAVQRMSNLRWLTSSDLFFNAARKIWDVASFAHSQVSLIQVALQIFSLKAVFTFCAFGTHKVSQ